MTRNMEASTMPAEQEYTPITIETDTVAIEIDYTDESKFKAGMQELRAQIQWISQCKGEIDIQHERLANIYDDCVKRYIEPEGESSATKLWIPRHLTDIRQE